MANFGQNSKGAPYLNRNPNGGDGNDAFEGFCKDLLDRLAALKNFNYVLRIADDPNIGELNKETGRYTGLIGELREFVSPFFFWHLTPMSIVIIITKCFLIPESRFGYLRLYNYTRA